MNINKEDLIEWCWENLKFDNCPDSWEETCILDILNNYNGNCHTHDGKVYSYRQIRRMFEVDEDDDIPLF